MTRKKKRPDKRYEFRKGARIGGGLTPDVVGPELERIASAHGGRLYPKEIVLEARPETSPLHPAFEWDDAKAGESWREHQARNLTRSVMVIEGREPPRTQFVHVPAVTTVDGEDRGGCYRDAAVVVKSVDEFALALEELQRKVLGAERALDELKRLAQGQEGSAGETLALIVMAGEALRTASEALGACRH